MTYPLDCSTKLRNLETSSRIRKCLYCYIKWAMFTFPIRRRANCSLRYMYSFILTINTPATNALGDVPFVVYSKSIIESSFVFLWF